LSTNAQASSFEPTSMITFSAPQDTQCLAIFIQAWMKIAQKWKAGVRSASAKDALCQTDINSRNIL
jgi:hypothetical protein